MLCLVCAIWVYYIQFIFCSCQATAQIFFSRGAFFLIFGKLDTDGLCTATLMQSSNCFLSALRAETAVLLKVISRWIAITTTGWNNGDSVPFLNARNPSWRWQYMYVCVIIRLSAVVFKKNCFYEAYQRLAGLPIPLECKEVYTTT
jgi:hypothetical protein